MTETLVKLETAKLAKEKGFDGLVYEYFSENGDPCDCTFTNINLSKKMNIYSRPSLGLLQKWLLDKHDLYVTVFPVDSKPKFWYFTIVDIETGKQIYDQSINFNNFSNALENGLFNALKTLK